MSRTEVNQPRIFLSPPHRTGSEVEYVTKAIESNYIAPVGPLLEEFEASFRSVTGFKYCTAVNSGSAALHVALRSVGVKAGDLVLASTYTFLGSVGAVYHLNAHLCFIDSEISTGNMDPACLERALNDLSKSGRKPAAVLPTDVYGQIIDIDAIIAICKKYDIPVVCDCAESLGATYKGKAAGFGANVAAFSFNGNKIVTTGGGGMVASNNRNIVAECAYLAAQARNAGPDYEHDEVGYNYRLSNVLAGIGVAQLADLDERVKAKRLVHSTYKSLIGDLSGISFLEELPCGKSNRWLTVVRINEDEFGVSPVQVREELERWNIESRPTWTPMHKQPCFRGYPFYGGGVAEKLHAEGLCLPSGAGLKIAEVEKICEIIRAMHHRNG